MRRNQSIRKLRRESDARERVRDELREKNRKKAAGAGRVGSGVGVKGESGKLPLAV